MHTNDFSEVTKPNMEAALKTLNNMGVKTVKGMDYNIERLWNAYYNIKRMKEGLDKFINKKED